MRHPLEEALRRADIDRNKVRFVRFSLLTTTAIAWDAWLDTPVIMARIAAEMLLKKQASEAEGKSS